MKERLSEAFKLCNTQPQPSITISPDLGVANIMLNKKILDTPHTSKMRTRVLSIGVVEFTKIP